MNWESVTEGPVLVAAVSAGNRSRVYSGFALKNPEQMRVVAVAEPNVIRREAFAEKYGIPPEMRFASFQELATRPRLAHAVINGTDDSLHHASTMALIETGYHMLLEKPIARSEHEIRAMIEIARRKKRLIMICHVLRYTAFYGKIKEMVSSGELGKIIATHLSENVSYHHMATGFVRGRWNTAAASNPMLMSKCCHDLDIIAWIMSPMRPARIASFGSLFQFKPENAPPGSAARCLSGCQIESTCHFSARSQYVVQGFGWGYPFETLRPGANLNDDEKIEALKREDNRYGRCVWHSDNDVVDHQTTMMQYPNGATVSLNMLGSTCRPTRTILVLGTRGELEGDFERGLITVRKPDVKRGPGYTEETFDVKTAGGGGHGGHGGGDSGIISDFISVIKGDRGSKALTSIEESAVSHFMGFTADIAMRENRVVNMLWPTDAPSGESTLETDKLNLAAH